MILTIDLGGTKLHAAVWQQHPVEFPEPVWQQKFLVRDFSRFEDAFTAVRSALTTEQNYFDKISVCVIALAAPIVGDAIALTNVNWIVRMDFLRLQWEQRAPHRAVPIYLINDLTAHACGIIAAHPGACRRLHGAGPDDALNARGNKVLLAAGTGLGTALIPQLADGRYVAVPSEGGHVSLSPVNADDAELLQYLWRQYPHVSAERVASGHFGFVNILNFLVEKSGAPLSPLLQRAMAGDAQDHLSMGACLMEEASGPNGSVLAKKTLQWFAHLLAVTAGNLALTAMATGGVYLGGGVAVHMRSYLASPDFFASFCAKGRFADFLRNQIPIYLVTDELIALRGAYFYAVSQVD